MEKQNLYVAWKNKPPLEGVNTWCVKGDIEYANGKLCFDITNGSHVEIDPEQIVTIGVSGNLDLSKYEKIKEMKLMSSENIKYWYAVVRHDDYPDWGYGSYDKDEAIRMAKEAGEDHYIAVIDESGNEPMCVEEIEV